MPVSKGTILVVDDEKAILDLAGVILKGAGYEVLVSDSGYAAFTLLEKRVQTLGAGAQGDPGWRVTDAPAGFRLRSARRLGDSVQLLYSDGLASVSVYVEPIAGAEQGESAMRRGAINVHSVWGSGRRVVAIGKVPAATVDLFARSARAVAAGSPVSR